MDDDSGDSDSDEDEGKEPEGGEEEGDGESGSEVENDLSSNDEASELEDDDENSDVEELSHESKDDKEASESDDEQSDENDEKSAGSSDEDDENTSSTNVMDLIPTDDYSMLNVGKGTARKRKAAWHDAADDEVLVRDVAANYRRAPGKHGAKDVSTEQYADTVQRKFKGLVGSPAWASLEKKDEDIAKGDAGDSDDEFFQETTDLLDRSTKDHRLKKGKLAYRRIADMNNESRNEGSVIRCTEFHPHSTVGLVAGLSGTATIVQIDGKTNPKIQTVNFKDFPVKTAKFSTDGNEVIVGSQHFPHFFVYDMIAGKIVKVPLRKKIAGGATNTQQFVVSPDGGLIALRGRLGSVHLLSARNKEYVGSLRMNDECSALAFSKSGTKLYTHGAGGEIYIWDMASRTCQTRFVDDGCISGSSVAVNSNYLAAGSSEGVVNLYNLGKLNSLPGNNLHQQHVKPDKVVLNLTTQINQLRFNPTGEILAMSSELKENACKLLHFPSMTVFENFPFDEKLSRVNSVCFSPGAGYMSLGNNKGRALLYRLRHYKDY
eukprot:TRINITY_DN16736_c0_g1_i2.p1 TRINITY_DN16736_c0_g1~~TRINITY_DN16736_c0_g1_i2.p1  ORF type:complete len:612 (-),score=195.92 TRINITY_DN16736_c0_g1_i2:70-1710(-)